MLFYLSQSNPTIKKETKDKLNKITSFSKNIIFIIIIIYKHDILLYSNLRRQNHNFGYIPTNNFHLQQATPV